MDDHRFEHVELQVALTGGKANGDIVAQYLAGQHRQRFALGRVDLARHDRTARFIGRQPDFGEAGARAGTQQAQIVGDFHQRHGEGFQRAGQRGQRLMTGQRGKLVRRGDKRQTGEGGQFCGDGLTKAVG
ncbi:hypothetical protein D9M69_575590 [compost metagenome]